MEKTFTTIEKAVIKRTAQNVQQFVSKKEKINAQMAEIENKIMEAARKKVEEKLSKFSAEKTSLQNFIDSFQGPIREMTGGYTTEDLVTREIEHTGKMDPKTGKEILKSRYVFKYPDTIVPPTDEAPAFEMEMPAAGNDFDLDKETTEAENTEVSGVEEADAGFTAPIEPAESEETDPFADSNWD